MSGAAVYQGDLAAGSVPDRVFGAMDARPRHVGLTLDSDTPYGPVVLDLHEGPVVIELPPGPLLGVVLDLHQRWLADMGLPRPDAGRGRSPVVLPPDGDGPVPAALDLLTRVVVRPLTATGGPGAASWIDVSGAPQDATPHRWEEGLEFRRVLHDVVDTEPHAPERSVVYGLLAALGIARGRPFAQDERMTRILGETARRGAAQLRVQSLADRRPDRVPGPARTGSGPRSGRTRSSSARDGDLDADARDKWFFQAIGVSPAMMRRAVGAGSLYWPGTRDATGAWLEGGVSYRLVVLQPVPARLFWSVTVYDAATRSQVSTPQGRAAIRSLFELADQDPAAPVELRFGPEDPGAGSRWTRTVPGAGWFAYVRAYGPEQPAFDGSWRLPDVERTG